MKMVIVNLESGINFAVKLKFFFCLSGQLIVSTSILEMGTVHLGQVASTRYYSLII